MPDTLLDTWNTLKKQADKSDAEVLDRLDKAYVASYVRLEPEIKALIEYIETMQKSGKVTQSQVKNSQAYKNLMREVADELDDYQAYLRTEVTTAVQESAKQGLQAGDLLLVTAIALSLGVDTKDVPKDTVKKPETLDAMDFLKKYLEKDGPLMQRISGTSKTVGIGDYYTQKIADGILQRVGDGMNPRLIGEWMIDEYGMGLTDAMRIARTSQLYSYREANNAVQVANSDLLEGVVWCAEMDDRTCMSCISLHGQRFDVGTVCDDHHNGRCAMLPWVKGMENPVGQTGEDWFKEQSGETQNAMMGEAMYNAWIGHAIDFSQISTTYKDDVYGEMRGVNSLLNILGEKEAKQYYSPNYQVPPVNLPSRFVEVTPQKPPTPLEVKKEEIKDNIGSFWSQKDDSGDW